VPSGSNIPLVGNGVNLPNSPLIAYPIGVIDN